MLNFEMDLDQIFGVTDLEIDVEVNIEDNQVTKASKHFDDSILTNELNEEHSSLISRVNVERVSNLTDGQVEGEHLNSSSYNESQSSIPQSHVEGELLTTQVGVE